MCKLGCVASVYLPIPVRGYKGDMLLDLIKSQIEEILITLPLSEIDTNSKGGPVYSNGEEVPAKFFHVELSPPPFLTTLT